MARTRGVPYSSVVSWVEAERKAPKKKHRQELRALESKLRDAELENRILKELLKKTNQLWLNDEPSVPSL